MDNIEHRQIINIFTKLDGMADTIADLSLRIRMEKNDVWDLVHKSFPETEDDNTRYNPETKTLEIEKDD